MKPISIICVFISSFVFSQAELEIELKTGITVNNNKMNPSHDQFDLNLQNGHSYGLGFDIWLPKNFGLSFGYSLSNSNVSGKIYFPENYGIESSLKHLGRLSEKIFYLGVKKKLEFSDKTSVSPFIGLFYNAFFFLETGESIGGGGVWYTNGDYHYHSTEMYGAFESLSNNFYGSIGTKIGATIEQKIGKAGTLSLNVSYALDLNKNLWIMAGSQSQTTIEDENGLILQQNTTGTLEHSIGVRRNLLMFELGYKMPCSISIGKDKKVKDL
jgi:hypothetical protein